MPNARPEFIAALAEVARATERSLLAEVR